MLYGSSHRLHDGTLREQRGIDAGSLRLRTGGEPPVIQDLGRSIGGSVLRRLGRAYSQVQERTPLKSDVLESDEEFLVVFDAPGASAGDVQVKYVDGSVLVRLDRFREFHEGYEMRFPGRGLSLDGEVELPADADVDLDAAQATLTDSGTLEVHVPKSDEVDTDADGVDT